MKRAFVFPGQGAQTIGMGQALAKAYPAARAVFQEVDDALVENLSALIWEGDIANLTLTQNAQPALMATSMAAMAALNAEGVDVSKVDFVAGHSLGEYSALCAAGSISLADTARLLRIRGEAMQTAVPVGVGAMAALLGLDLPERKRLQKKPRKMKFVRRPTTMIRVKWLFRVTKPPLSVRSRSPKKKVRNGPLFCRFPRHFIAH